MVSCVLSPCYAHSAVVAVSARSSQKNPEQAKHLIALLLAHVPDAFVRMDIPSDSGLAPWLEEAGLKHVDTVAQMARGTPPQAIGEVHQFALVTQAIG